MPFTKANGHSFAVAGAEASIESRKQRPPRRGSRNQIIDMLIVAHADACADETPVSVKASLMRAYVDLQELRMSLEGFGRPKPVEARNATPKRKRSETAPVVYPGPSATTQAAVVEERKGE